MRVLKEKGFARLQRKERIDDLRHDGIVVAVEAWEQGPAGGEKGQKVGANLVPDRTAVPAEACRPEVAQSAWFCGHLGRKSLAGLTNGSAGLSLRAMNLRCETRSA